MGAASCKPSLGCHHWNSMEPNEYGEKDEIASTFLDTLSTQKGQTWQHDGDRTLVSGCETVEDDIILEPTTPTVAQPEPKKRRSELLSQVSVIARSFSSKVKVLDEAMEDMIIRKGTEIGRQGEEAEEIFVICSGQVSMWAVDDEDESDFENGGKKPEPQQVGTLSRGDLFEEAALAPDDRTYSCTYYADTDVSVLMITVSQCEELGLCSSSRGKRKVVGRSGMSRMTRCATTASMDSCASQSSTSSKKGAEKTPEEQQFLMKALQHNVNLLKFMPSSANFARDIVDLAWKEAVPAQKDVIRQGDSLADTFYIVESGKFAVYIQEQPPKRVSVHSVNLREGEALPEPKINFIRNMERGSSFGELALLYSAPRSATVTAIEESEVWVLDRKTFKDMLKKVATENVKEYLGYLDGMEVMQSLNTPEKELVAKALDRLHLKEGEVVFKTGDRASAFYILLDGTVQIDKEGKLPRVVHASLDNNKVRYFGDRALIEDRPRSATVTVVSQTARALTMDRDDFNMLLGPLSQVINKGGESAQQQDEASLFAGYLDLLEIMTSLSSFEKMNIAKALTHVRKREGDIIFRRGEPADAFYILLDGSLDAFDGATWRSIEACANEGKVRHFGDKAILENTPRKITVKVTSKIASMLSLDVNNFNMLLGPLRDSFKRFDRARKAENRKLQIDLHDLNKLGLLGCAQFGPVDLCQHTVTGEVYALKTLHKGCVVKNEMQAGVMRERECWLKADHPFIVKLHALYNQKLNLYFLCDYLPGGALADLYNRKSLYGSLLHAKFYVATMVLALKHLHKRRVMHRDMRPENILLAETGHPKLIDFGLAKCVIGKTYTTCGSPDYMAPEILVGTGHTRAVDWWSVGVMAFELMAGYSPFTSPSPMDVYSNVMRGIEYVRFPRELNGKVADFVLCLCKSEPVERLAMRQGGADNLHSHDFFDGFDWKSLKETKMVPPFKPVLKSTTDRSHYKASRANVPKPIRYQDNGSDWDKDFALTRPAQQDTIE